MHDELRFPQKEDLEKAIRAARAKGAEFAEVYLEKKTSDTVRIEERVVREASRGITMGAGVRAIVGEKIGYAYTDDIDPKSLVDAAKVAGEIAALAAKTQVVRLKDPSTAKAYSAAKILPLEVEATKKMNITRAADESARQYDGRITEVLVALADQDKTIQIANSEGVNVSDRQILILLRVTAIAEARGLRQRGFRSLSGVAGYEIFQQESPEHVARDAARQAVQLLDAQEAPAGKMVLVLGNGRGGVLLHEAIGHGFEGDCTIVDDATVAGRRGTVNIDDEGVPGQRSILVENGVLRGFIYDKLNAKLMNTSSTGNGRRESYRSMPVPRMTNTFMLAGDVSPEEIISSVSKGFYAKRIAGGQVDISSGSFVFEVMEGYLIEDGKVKYPVRGANLIGDGAEVLKKIVMVGNDFAYDRGGGTCGKAGQGVPVGNGIPTVKISEITVGGTKS
jgi:TldD protein